MFGEREEGEDTFKKGSILQMYNRNKQKKLHTMGIFLYCSTSSLTTGDNQYQY